MLRLNKVRELILPSTTDCGRLSHLSAASGLVRVGPWLCVIADDEHHLGVFALDDDTPGRLITLFPGELPATRHARKKLKPDLEALTLLPPFAQHPYGALFALGSGSRPNRRQGVLLTRDATGAVAGASRLIDLSDLYRSLEERFHDLNIEGAVLFDDRLRLLQRGNKRHAENAIIDLHLPAVLEALSTGAALGNACVADSQTYDLGEIDGVPLCFTDGAALPGNHLLFSAIAENTEDNYADGACIGAALGIIGSDGQIRLIQQLEKAYKIEGVDARVEQGIIHLLLVTDADDAAIPAVLLSGEIAGYAFDGQGSSE